MLNDPTDYTIRPLTAADEPTLWEMLYQALQSSEGGGGPAREIIRQPDFARYVEEWGRAGDVGFIAYDQNHDQALGAVWQREALVKAEGAAGDAVPELAFAVRSGHRRRGIGAALLTQWVRSKPEQSAVHMRVAPSSPAVRLYERFGFKVTGEGAGSVTLRRDV